MPVGFDALERTLLDRVLATQLMGLNLTISNHRDNAAHADAEFLCRLFCRE